MCGYYLALGMPLDEYWNASPHFVRYYQEAHRKRNEQKNQELWLQGLYIYNAFSTVLAGAFGKKGGRKPRYLEKPIDLYPEDRKSQEDDRAKMINNTVNTLNSLYRRFNKNTEGKEDG